MWSTFEAGTGRTLSYLRRGEGPLVVCVPGGPGMDPQAYFAPLELPGFELLIFAPRGTGASTPPASSEGYRIAGYVEDLESLRLHLGAGRLALYGNSHGGMASLAYACAHPERVARLAIVNAPARLGEAFQAAVSEAETRFGEAVPGAEERVRAAREAGEEMDTVTGEAERRRLFRTLMARYVAREGERELAYLDRLCSAPMNWDAAEPMYEELVGGLDLLEQAGAVSAPALVMGCEFDVTVPAATMREIAAALPDARYVQFDGVGHFRDVEASERVVSTLEAFLSE